MGAADVLSSAEAGGRVIRGSIWRVAGSVAGIAAGLGTATLLMRHLGVVGAGRYVTVMSLVAIATSVVDVGLNVSASRELALRRPEGRPALMGNVLGQRMWVTPIAIAAIVAFALLAGYPQSMRVGALLAGAGLYVMAIGDALLLPLTVELRNAGLALVDFLKHAVTLGCVAVLVALGAHLTAFFAVLILAGLATVAAVPALTGRRAAAPSRSGDAPDTPAPPRRAFAAPRLDRREQRALLSGALPLAAALVLSQLYFRIVILLMSLISDPRQTGYFAGSLRAIETLLGIPILVAGVALPLLAAAARDDRARLRNAIEGLSEGALLAGAMVVLVGVRAAEPLMSAIGGPGFAPAGAVLRIQAVALLFGALVQIWAVALVALARQRELILTNGLGLLAIAGLAAVLVPALGARGGALASVLGDALLAALTLWRLRASAVKVGVRAGFLARLAVAAAAGCIGLVLPGLPDLAAAGLAAALFLGAAQLVGIVPDELHDALGVPVPLRRRAGMPERRSGRAPGR